MALITAGASTQSRATRPGKPVTIERCSGVYEFTKDGRGILSWPMGQYGPLLGFPSFSNFFSGSIVAKLETLMQSGHASIGSYAPDAEEQLAETLVKRFARYMTSTRIGVRFFSNGTDATQAAATLSRYANGANPKPISPTRLGIISIGYHGGSSPIFNFPPQDGGFVERKTFHCEFGEYLEKSYKLVDFGMERYSAIAVEIPSLNREWAGLETMYAISSDCRNHGLKLIMDEIVTGFRMNRVGAISYYNTPDHDDDCDPYLKADFICLGKALSTYGKISALLGPADIMNALEDKVFASYTFNDHPFGIYDAIETLRAYDALGDELYNHINSIGSALKDGLNTIFLRRGFEAGVFGHPSRTAIESQMKPEVYWEFLSRLVDNHDVLIHRPNFATMAHTMTDVERTIAAADNTLAEMGFELQ